MKLLMATKDRSAVNTLLTSENGPKYLSSVKRLRETIETYKPVGKKIKPKALIISHANYISQLDISFQNIKKETYYINLLRLAPIEVNDALLQILHDKLIEQADSFFSSSLKKNLKETLLHLLTGNQLVESRDVLKIILTEISTMHLNFPIALATLIGIAEAYQTTVKEMSELLQFDFPFDFKEIEEEGVVRFHINGELYIGAAW